MQATPIKGVVVSHPRRTDRRGEGDSATHATLTECSAQTKAQPNQRLAHPWPRSCSPACEMVQHIGDILIQHTLRSCSFTDTVTIQNTSGGATRGTIAQRRRQQRPHIQAVHTEVQYVPSSSRAYFWRMNSSSSMSSTYALNNKMCCVSQYRGTRGGAKHNSVGRDWARRANPTTEMQVSLYMTEGRTIQQA
jgi:hypothetical protein